jgi:hypothetical protein
VGTRSRHGAAIVTLVALACAAAGCGELGGDTRPEQKTPLVTARQLDQYRPGTPARAFLEWFQALQVGKTRELARHYVPSLGLTWTTLEVQRRAGAYAIDPLAPPLIKGVKTDGRNARVDVRFRTGRIWPNGRVDYRTTREVSFDLRREGGRWLLVDNGFLELVSKVKTTPTKGVPLVSRRLLSRYSAGSPGRAFLEWFRALQRSDAATAVRYYAPSLELTASELVRQRARADGFNLLGPPKLLAVRTNGARATISLRLRTARNGGSGPIDFLVSAPTSFELQKVGGRWVLPSNGFLQVLARIPSG